MRTYALLDPSVFETENMKLVPIRHEDRYAIMNWRNEQIAYLRQAEPLTLEAQEHYFNTTVASLFDKKKPHQLLFSFLENESLIGYGGLVHLDWKNKHAEVSFLLSTEQGAEDCYLKLFPVFLLLLEKVARQLCLNKIFTYGYDIEEYRFLPLKEREYNLDARLVKHKLIDGIYRDVLIYSKLL